MDAASTTDDEPELWRRFVASRDSALRLQLLDAHLTFARIMAAKLYSRRGGLAADFSDYLQSAVVGLIEAVDHYDPSRGIPFRVYAVPRIRGAILDALPSMSELHARMLRPGALHERSVSLSGFSESVDEGDDYLMSLEQMAELTLELGIGFLLEDGGEECAPEEEIDLGAYEDAQRHELANLFAWLVQRLAPDQAHVVRYHYFYGIDFQTIAQMLDLSRARVSQLHREALKRLRKLYAEGSYTASGCATRPLRR
jgi:RNA polymerase sigma factor for flagellar operon FliA